ncbi:unnamed protein product [Urochloa humidicola]
MSVLSSSSNATRGAVDAAAPAPIQSVVASIRSLPRPAAPIPFHRRHIPVGATASWTCRELTCALKVLDGAARRLPIVGGRGVPSPSWISGRPSRSPSRRRGHSPPSTAVSGDRDPRRRRTPSSTRLRQQQAGELPIPSLPTVGPLLDSYSAGTLGRTSLLKLASLELESSAFHSPSTSR